MNDDYLWDRSGPPDLEIARLEQRLAPLRYRHVPLLRAQRPGWAIAGALTAALAAAAACLLLTVAPEARSTSWQVAGTRLRQGQTLRTGQAGVHLEAADVGRVDLDANSVLRATGARSLSLDRGRLHAFIWAPPRQFVVSTPSARAVDLGCEYTLTVDPEGGGLVRVSMGWVAFQVGDREAFIPAGASCVTRKHGGPGIPWFDDAPEALRSALVRFEAGDPSALGPLLAAARPRDSLTLWHLLTRVPQSARASVFDRLRDLVPLAAGVSRDAVLRRDPRAIDQCWNALGLENTGWWRGWERPWL